jgi:hypothetical protein
LAAPANIKRLSPILRMSNNCCEVVRLEKIHSKQKFLLPHSSLKIVPRPLSAGSG